MGQLRVGIRDVQQGEDMLVITYPQRVDGVWMRPVIGERMVVRHVLTIRGMHGCIDLLAVPEVAMRCQEATTILSSWQRWPHERVADIEKDRLNHV